MYNVVVEWLSEDRSRARFALPGREEWTAQHVSDLIQVLVHIREEMTPAAEHARIALPDHAASSPERPQAR